MSDDVDLANDFGEKMLEKAINQRPKFDGASLFECLECGEEIPEQRRRLGNVKYCIGCQAYFEKRV